MPERSFSDASFQKYLNEGRLMGCRCKGCGKVYAPPRPLCPGCRSTAMEWVEMSGLGSLAAFTAITVPPPALKKQGYGRGAPYSVGVVELEEGPRVVARLQGLDLASPESVELGQKMRVEYLKPDSEENGAAVVLGFRPRA